MFACFSLVIGTQSVKRHQNKSGISEDNVNLIKFLWCHVRKQRTNIESNKNSRFLSEYHHKFTSWILHLLLWFIQASLKIEFNDAADYLLILMNVLNNCWIYGSGLIMPLAFVRRLIIMEIDLYSYFIQSGAIQSLQFELSWKLFFNKSTIE